jgi:hypothetical protein
VNLDLVPGQGAAVMTTLPPSGIPRTFGAFALSDTPDPKPGNNYAEGMLR